MSLFKKLRRWVYHKLTLFVWRLAPGSRPIDFYAESINSIAARWDGEIDPLMTYHGMFDILRQRKFSGTFLELGGGYSTILAPLALNIPFNNIHSVDFNPEKYDRILNSRLKANKFFNQINLYSQITVSFAEVEAAVDSILKQIFKFPCKDIEAAMRKYGVPVDVKFEADGLWFDQVKKLFWTHPAANQEKTFYQDFGAMEGQGFCSSGSIKQIMPQAIFFDCGELSSIAEFNILSSQVEEGVYVMFHDIYYPKSIKNFLTCVLLELSPQWRILYCDSVSAQGGLLALKKNDS